MVKSKRSTPIGISPLNVLLITARADIGGGPKSTYNIASGLSDSCRVFIASPRDRPYYDVYKACSKIQEVHVIPHRRFTLLALWRLLLFIERNKIELINSNGNGAGLYARLVKLLFPHVKVIHTFRGLNIKDSHSWKRKLYFQYERWAGILTSKFINVSWGEQQACLHYNVIRASKSVIIRNGIDPVERTEPADVIKANRDKFIIVSLTRFDYPKNMGLSVCIAEKLRTYEDISFIWVGDGEEKDEIAHAIAAKSLRNVSLPGFSNQVGSFLPYANLYLSTSRREGLPLALLEAASVGLPILATDVIGNNEVVTDGHDGFLFRRK